MTKSSPICRATLGFTGRVYICQLAPNHPDNHFDGEAFWEVVSETPERALSLMDKPA